MIHPIEKHLRLMLTCCECGRETDELASNGIEFICDDADRHGWFATDSDIFCPNCGDDERRGNVED